MGKAMTLDKYLTPKELEDRWRSTVSVGTLANWRSTNQGPKFVKIGGRVLYPITFVEEYEQKRVRGAK